MRRRDVVFWEMWQSAACKPGSVENGHLSKREVASALKRYCGNRTGRPMRSLHLAPDGVYMTAQSPGRRCALTAPFHPYRGFPRRYLSVALALESPPPAVSRHPCPAVPGLSSCPKGLRPFSRLCHRGHYTAKESVCQNRKRKSGPKHQKRCPKVPLPSIFSPAMLSRPVPSGNFLPSPGVMNTGA